MNDGDKDEDYEHEHEHQDEDSMLMVDEDEQLHESGDDFNGGEEESEGSDEDLTFSKTIRDYAQDQEEIFIITELVDFKKGENVD